MITSIFTNSLYNGKIMEMLSREKYIFYMLFGASHGTLRIRLFKFFAWLSSELPFSENKRNSYVEWFRENLGLQPSFLDDFCDFSSKMTILAHKRKILEFLGIKPRHRTVPLEHLEDVALIFSPIWNNWLKCYGAYPNVYLTYPWGAYP